MGPGIGLIFVHICTGNTGYDFCSWCAVCGRSVIYQDFFWWLMNVLCIFAWLVLFDCVFDAC